MTATQIESSARRYREEFCAGNLAVADELLAPDAQAHISDSLTPEVPPGSAAFKEVIVRYQTAFPNAQYHIEDIVVTDNKVAVRWSAHGTHTGPLGELAPTGKQVNVTGMDIYHFRNGQIVAVWTNWDALGFLKQLGVA